MKVRKAIKRIAALGVGATFIGATLMGAMAADLSEYPEMFIEDGQFNGLLVVGKEALAIDTIGVTNIALGLQKAAVTRTLVCGGDSGSSTTVSGETVQIAKTGDDLNIGEELADIQDVALDDGDLPSILADGTYDENEGETDNDVSYTQEIALGTTTGDIVFEQDDDDAPEAGVYLLFNKGTDMYTYTLEFDDAVEYDSTSTSTEANDLESTMIEIQGKPYTITKAEFSSHVLDKLTMLVGDSLIWLTEGETITQEVNGVDHTIKMVDVTADADACGIEIDGSIVWIDVDDAETVSGVTVGVTEARAIRVADEDQDICRITLGASELVLEDGQEVDMDGEAIDGSLVTISASNSGTTGTWTSLAITYDPDDDLYLAEGDELVDPVFGNFKFIVGNTIASYEEIVFESSGNDGSLTFINFDDEEVVIPYSMDETTGAIVLGEEPDQGANPEDGFYIEGDACAPDSNDWTDCQGAQFLAVTTGDVAHVIELASIDDLTNADAEIDFDDITYGTSTDNKDYGFSRSGCTNVTADEFYCDFSLGSGVGAIRLTFNTTTDAIEFTDIDKSVAGVKTQNEGIINLDEVGSQANRSVFSITENDEESNNVKINVTLAAGASPDDDLLEISTVGKESGTGTLYGGEDFSEDNDDVQVYMTTWGSRMEVDAEDDNDLTLWHPQAQLNVEVFVAETGATTSVSEGAGEGCQVSESINPIPATVNKFDTEVSNPGAQNLISVGGPCANAVTSALLGDPEVCYEGFESGKAMLKLVESGSNVALIVAGGEGSDTQLASRIMQDYENYDLSGMEMVATTVSASGLKVEPVS